MKRISQYIDDESFIQWIFAPTEELEKQWTDYYKRANKRERKNIDEAKSVLLQFKSKRKEITEKEKLDLFSAVLHKIERREKSRVLHLFHSHVVRYAAIAIVFFALGAILFYQRDNQPDDFLFAEELNETVSEGDAKLIRYTGESIDLEKDKSTVAYSNDGLLVVNQDTIKSAPTSKAPQQEALNQLIIPYGKNSEILLADGTKVYLNAGTRLVYPEQFTGSKRQVFLSGEAFFEVCHDPEHPFIVKTSDLSVEVLGTHFNVSAYPSDNIIETVLTEGKVVLQKNKSGLFEKKTELVPNQLASFDKRTSESTLRFVDVENYVSWKDQILKFESSDLFHVLSKVERYYNIRFSYSDLPLKDILISGKLELQESQDELIARISRTASVDIVKTEENRYEIRNKE